MLMGDLQEVVMMNMGTGKGSHADQESTISYSFRLPATSPISIAPTLPLPPLEMCSTNQKAPVCGSDIISVLPRRTHSCSSAAVTTLNPSHLSRDCFLFYRRKNST